MAESSRKNPESLGDKIGQAAKRWQTLFDDSPFAIFIYQADGTVKDGNRAAAELFHLSPTQSVDILGDYNILEDEMLRRKGLQPYLDQAFSGTKTALPVFRYDLDNVSYGVSVRVWVQGALYPLKNADGRVEEVFMIVLDVSDRENARRDLDHIYRTSPVGLCLVGCDKRYIRVNQQMADANGYSESDHIGKSFAEIVPDLADTIEPWFDTVLRTKQPLLDKEVRGTTEALPVQQRVWRWSCYPAFNEADELHGVSAVVQDVSEIVQAEEALLSSEERFREIADNIRDVFWLFDWAEQKVIYVSPAYEQIWGRSIQSLYDNYNEWSRSIHPDDQEEAAAGFVRITETGGGELREYRIIHTDGNPRWIADRGFAIRDSEGNVVRVAGIAADITASKQAEARLRESEERLRAVVDNSPLVLWAIDSEGTFTLSEGKGLAALGLKPGQIVGESLFEVYKDYPEIIDDAREVLDGRPVHSRIEVERIIYENRHVPRLNEHGECVGAIGLSFDVTEQARAEENQVRLENQIRQTQKYESLGVLAGGIAHDFNNLLMGIMGNADIALKELPPGIPGRDYLSQIETAATRAAELTSQLLAYSGKGKFVIEEVDLNRLVNEMGQLLNTVISKKAFLRYNLSDRLPVVRADASQLRQIVMNLITNASEALHDQSGYITLSTGTLDVDRETIQSSFFQVDLAPGRYVFFEVSDTGEGMSKDTQQRIFDPFFTTKFTGRGLGLAAVLGIVRGHQGGVHVHSAEDEGTTIRVFLPPSPNALPECQQPEETASADLKGKTILVVDDELAVREVVRAILESSGCNVLMANDGAEGVKVFRANCRRISLVILDMTMPELSGEEAFRQIKQIDQDVKVLLTSGYNEPDATSGFGGEGLAGFISKPFRAADLLATIGGILGPGRP